MNAPNILCTIGKSNRSSKYGQDIKHGVQEYVRVGNDRLIIFFEGDFHSRISGFQDAGKSA